MKSAAIKQRVYLWCRGTGKLARGARVVNGKAPCPDCGEQVPALQGRDGASIQPHGKWKGGRRG